MTKPEYRKDKSKDAADVALGNKHLNFLFKQDLFTYKGHESTQFDSICGLIPGNSYFVVDLNFESHYIVNLMKLVRACSLGEFGDNRLLFIDDDKDYWVVKPSACLNGFSIKLTLNGEHVGKNLKRKIVLVEEESYTIKDF